MAVGKSVQFRGIKSAVNAYENMAVPAWGLFQGTQFLKKYDGDNLEEGKAELLAYLNMMDLRSADMNTYTLCIYDNVKEKITSGTKYDASFNFRLADNIEDYQQNKIAGGLEQRLAGLEKNVATLIEPDEPEPLTAKEKMWEAVGKILEHPQVQNAIAIKVLAIVDGLGDAVGSIFKKNPLAQVAAIGSTSHSAEATDTVQENARLQEAVNILVTVDPQLGTNLLKLAGIAKADPAKYNLLISMLKGM
jgi:hypothetical protein